MGQMGYEGFSQVDTCQNFFVITADQTAPSPIEGAETMAQAMAGQPAEFESVATEATDTAVILYTSGTTGQPKGAELSHSNMVMNALTCNRLFDSVASRHDTHLMVLPLFHSFGQTVNMNAGFSTAATLVLLPRFAADQALALMQKEEHHLLRWCADDVLGPAQRPERGCRRRADRAQPPARGVRRFGAAGGDPQAVQGEVRRPDPGGLRVIRDVAGRHLQRPRPGPAARLDRGADLGSRREAGRRRLEQGRRRSTRSARSRSAVTTS